MLWLRFCWCRLFVRFYSRIISNLRIVNLRFLQCYKFPFLSQYATRLVRMPTRKHRWNHQNWRRFWNLPNSSKVRKQNNYSYVWKQTTPERDEKSHRPFFENSDTHKWFPQRATPRSTGSVGMSMGDALVGSSSRTMGARDPRPTTGTGTGRLYCEGEPPGLVPGCGNDCEKNAIRNVMSCLFLNNSWYCIF